MKNWIIGTLSTLLIWLFTATPAHAYVDPGSGSVIVTTILGVFAAIGYTCRKYFYKLKRLFVTNDSVVTNESAEDTSDDGG